MSILSATLYIQKYFLIDWIYIYYIVFIFCFIYSFSKVPLNKPLVRHNTGCNTSALTNIHWAFLFFFLLLFLFSFPLFFFTRPFPKTATHILSWRFRGPNQNTSDYIVLLFRLHIYNNIHKQIYIHTYTLLHATVGLLHSTDKFPC